MLDSNNCKNGEEQYEQFTSSTNKKNYIQYDYRDKDGELFSVVRKNLNECKAARDEWLLAKENNEKSTQYTHIEEVWNDLEVCKSKEEIEKVIDNVPRSFGEWYVEEIEGGVQVMNTYEFYGSYQEDKQDFFFEEIETEVSIQEKLDESYIIGYSLEVGSDEADKYVKKLDLSQDSFNEIYKDGKDMWDNGEVSKFVIAIFEKQTDSLVTRYRPDKSNFKYRTGDTYQKITDLFNDLEDEKQYYKDHNMDYSSFRLQDEKLTRRQLSDKGYVFQNTIDSENKDQDVNIDLGE